MACEPVIDREQFQRACQRVIHLDYQRDSIGILKEKTLHAVLKHCFEPHPENHEIQVGGYVADIVGEHGIIEIQTRSFRNLKNKLPAFLEACPVTVVYPVDSVKWLCWVDPLTGETTRRRRSPKRGTVYEAFWELYQIREYLSHPNLTVRVLLLETEEYRYLNGWSWDRKRGSTRCDRIPLDLLGEVDFTCPADYLKVLPPSLKDPFTVQELARAAGVGENRARSAVSVLKELGAVFRQGKQSRAYLYTRNQE